MYDFLEWLQESANDKVIISQEILNLISSFDQKFYNPTGYRIFRKGKMFQGVPVDQIMIGDQILTRTLNSINKQME